MAASGALLLSARGATAQAGAVAVADDAAIAAAAPARPARAALLLNGDRVMLPAVGGSRAVVIPADRPGSAGMVMSFGLAGRRYEVPAAALPYLGRGLDPRLFDVGLLMARERHGRLDVRVRYRGQVPALPGITLTAAGHGRAAGYLTAASARAFGAALTRQYTADHARDSYGTDGLFAGGTQISLTGTRPATPPAHPDFPMDTVTVNASDLNGQPDTGDVVQLINVDNFSRLEFGQGLGNFYHGVAKLSVPAGHYLAIGELGGGGITPPTRLVVVPQFTTRGHGTVITMREAAARRITMVAPRPTAVLSTGFGLERTDAAGGIADIEASSGSLWVSPDRTRPTVGKLRVAASQHLESPPGPGVPYEYTLSFTSPPGTIPPQRFVARSSDLATINERFYQAIPSTGYWSFNGAFPAANPNVPSAWFGFIEPDGPMLTYPGQLTEYAGGTGSSRMEWGGQYFSGGTYQVENSRLLHPGEHLTDNWGAYPLHPAPNVNLNQEQSMFGAFTPSAVRGGSTLRLDLDPFNDNQPGHVLDAVPPASLGSVTGSYEIDQNGRKIAGGDAAPRLRPYGNFRASARLGARPSTIRFSLALARTGSDFPLSTTTRTIWTWRSARRPGVALPRYWSCAMLTTRRDCAVEPMMTLWYRVAGLSLDGSVPAGRQTVHLSVGHLQRARSASITREAMSVSFDGGQTWHQAQVTGNAGSYTAVFTAPAGAKVTLRTSAADAAGGSVTETITSAFQVAS